MADLNDVRELMRRIERLDKALASLEGVDETETRDGVKWAGKLEEIAAPDLSQIVSALGGLVSRFEHLVDGEGFARFAAKMRREGDTRDPHEVYAQTHRRLAQDSRSKLAGRCIATMDRIIGNLGRLQKRRKARARARDVAASLPVDSRRINARNAAFWEKQGVRNTTQTAQDGRPPRTTLHLPKAGEVLADLAARQDHGEAVNRANADFWAKQHEQR